ncbi:hypothetical protein [Absidia glauca]|uniref:DNL-type domain-containing protein n=1 Tax=Absidia glauca TaxID=4829 RepID=A0A168P3W8_ABSGL|nr:hypothetical protein [Absidia glauca]
MLRSVLRQHAISRACRQLKPTITNVPSYHKSLVSFPYIAFQHGFQPSALFPQQRNLHATRQRWHQAPPPDGTPEEHEVVDPKHQLLIGFTCKVCEVRSHHLMSKHAYTKGVVLIQCPDCKNRHLIADNLGWFQDEKTNVEDLVKEKGEAIRKVVVDEQGNKLPVEHLMEWVPKITAEEEERIQVAKDKAAKIQQEKEKDNV